MAAKIYRFQEHNLVIEGEEDDLLYIAELLRNAEGTVGDLRYQIEREFNVDGINEEEEEMQSAWFVVTCEVDNGCRIEEWRSIVNALTASQAKLMVYEDWKSRDNETTAKILSVRHLSEIEIISMKVRTIA